MKHSLHQLYVQIVQVHVADLAGFVSPWLHASCTCRASKPPFGTLFAAQGHLPAATAMHWSREVAVFASQRPCMM
jgi:hypothetical protein